jgi:predicted Zn-dependent protease
LNKTRVRNRKLVLVGAVNVALLFIANVATLGARAQTVGTSAPAPSSAALPNLGDGTNMTPSAERRLGDRIARELYRDPDYVDDPLLTEYVQSIWQPLLAAARQRGDITPEMDETYAWELILARDRTVNAFALPGAYMGLHLGLVGVVTSRDELASVLSHELSHVTQRHIARMMMRQSQQAPWMVGAMILGILAAGKSPDAANAMIVGGQAVGAQTQLNFSRDMEREADRVGFGVSTQAGFAPKGFVSMFGKLQQASRLNDSGNFPYLRSHPLTTERMAEMQSRIDMPPSDVEASTGGARQNQPEYDQSMLAARARVMANTAVDALRTWSQEAESSVLRRTTSVQQAATLYGATLASIRLRDHTAAQGYWQRLTEVVRADAPAARLARLLGVELALAMDDGARAVQLLNASDAGSAPAIEGRVELFLKAQAWLKRAASAPAGSPAAGVSNQALASVTQSLQTWVADHPRDAQAWQLLSSTYAAQGRTLSSIRAQAEINVAQLDYPAALARFKAAQDWVRKEGANADHYEASIVDTRTRQIESLVREQALER